MLLILALACGAAEPVPAPAPAPPPVVAPAPAAPAPAPAVPEPAAPEPAVPEPTFSGTVAPLSPALRAAMTGVTWTEGCPVGLDELALLTVQHWDMDGAPAEGRLVVAAAHADALVGVFSALFDAGFRITRMAPAHELGGDDDALMAADVTSAFNCRKKTGGSSYSEHSYGHAIDLNPLRNPYVKGTRVLPPEGRPFADRSDARPGMVLADGPVEQAFRAIGWRWGGRWRSLKDYQHFSATGR